MAVKLVKKAFRNELIFCFYQQRENGRWQLDGCDFIAIRPMRCTEFRSLSLSKGEISRIVGQKYEYIIK